MCSMKTLRYQRNKVGLVLLKTIDTFVFEKKPMYYRFRRTAGYKSRAEAFILTYSNQ